MKGAPRKSILLNTPLLVNLLKTNKIIIFDYFKPYNPLGSVFKSLKIQNETFLLKGAPRIPISLTTLLMDLISQKLKKNLDYFEPFQPSESVFNSLKIPNEPFLLKGAPRNSISLNTPILDFVKND